MYSIAETSRFKRDYRKAVQRGYNMNLLAEVITLLATGEPLPGKYRDHALIGNWKDFRECHVASDWLLIYKIEADILVLTLQRTGTHSDLF